MQTEEKKAAVVCLIALVLSIIFFPACFILSKVTGVFALFALSWQILGAAVIWAILTVQFYQRALAEQEKFDIAQLAQSSHSDTIFEAQKQQSEYFAVSQNRLRIFEKWFLPIFSLLLAGYQIALGAILIRKIINGQLDSQEPKNLLLAAVLASAMAFLSFLYSLYAIGLSVQEKWKPIRAGAGAFLATALLSFLIAAAMALAQFKIQLVLTVLSYVVPAVLLLVGCEIILNFVFDLYRPRIKGQYNIAAFDSRLLAVLAAPQNIVHTVSSFIDYQFGFKVSQTWFYKIVEQAVIPLVIVSSIILYMMSCLVIVEPGSQAIIEKLGSPYYKDGSVRIVDAGISFKLPWPFGIARILPTKEIQEIYVGYVPNDDGKKEALLWDKEHYKEEYNLLVATESINSQEQGAVPVSIIRAAIPVQYRITDLYKYVYNHADSKEILKNVCYRELVNFAAGARVEPESESGQESLLGAGRAAAAAVVMQNIQRKADELGLGVEIVFMGFEGFHPPPTVAQDFQAVVGAVQKKQAQILDAITQRDKIFTGNTGSVKKAEDLHRLAAQYMAATRNGNQAEIDKIKQKLDDEFSTASGELFLKLREAKSYAFEKSMLAKATGERFSQQLQAYQASKDIYTHELKMEMLEESLEKIRKFVVVSDADSEVTIVDLQEKLVPSLYEAEPGK